MQNSREIHGSHSGRKTRNLIGLIFGEERDFLSCSALTEQGHQVLLKYCCGSREEVREGESLASLDSSLCMGSVTVLSRGCSLIW